MSLVTPTTGEIVDRLTILALKRLHGRAAAKDVAHFDEEWAALLAPLPVPGWFAATLDLAAVNSALWAAEDALRGYRLALSPLTPAGYEAAADMAFRIQTLNDRRAALIQTINEAAGEHTGPEKL